MFVRDAVRSAPGKPGRDLLQEPAVAVGITERCERPVALPFGPGAFYAPLGVGALEPAHESGRTVEHRAHVYSAPQQLVARRFDVGDDEVTRPGPCRAAPRRARCRTGSSSSNRAASSAPGGTDRRKRRRRHATRASRRSPSPGLRRQRGGRQLSFMSMGRARAPHVGGRTHLVGSEVTFPGHRAVAGVSGTDTGSAGLRGERPALRTAEHDARRCASRLGRRRHRLLVAAARHRRGGGSVRS